MERIDPRIPLTEVTATQYAAMELHDSSMLYGIPYAGQTADYTQPETQDSLRRVLTIPYLLDSIPFFDEGTLYCVANLSPLLASDSKIFVTSDSDLMCVKSADPYQTGLSGILLMDKSEYDDLQAKDADTKYIVTNGEEVHEYLGDIFIK